ncbi:MAG: hypothetical protein WD696_08665 [Bryobacteraceae bacterium]
MAQRKPTTEKTKKLDINPVTGFRRGSIQDKLRTLGLQVPKEEWDRLPKDRSSQLDHYLYGTPKR